MRLVRDLVQGLLLSDAGVGLRGLDVVDVLFEDGPDYEREGGEDEVVEGDVDVIEDCLAGVAAVEGEDELRDREQHVLVEEVQDHLGDADVVPPPVHQQQPPQHAELGQCVVTCLNGAHALLAEEADSDVGGFDHRYVVGAVADGERDLFQPFSDYAHHFCLLDGQQAAADHGLAVLGQVRQLNLVFFVADDGRKVIALNQKRLRLLVFGQLLGPPSQLTQHLRNLIGILALVSQYLKVILNEVAALGDILGGLHLISSQHPYLDVYINKSSTGSDEVSDCFWDVVLEAVEDSSCADEEDVLLKLRDKEVVGFLLVGWRKLLNVSSELSVLSF